MTFNDPQREREVDLEIFEVRNLLNRANRRAHEIKPMDEYQWDAIMEIRRVLTPLVRDIDEINERKSEADAEDPR